MLPSRKETIVDITNLPEDIKPKAYEAYRDSIQGNDSYIRVYPYDVLYNEEDEDGYTPPVHERRIMTWEEFSEGYDNRNMYDFLVYCVNEGQRTDFLLLYWW